MATGSHCQSAAFTTPTTRYCPGIAISEGSCYQSSENYQGTASLLSSTLFSLSLSFFVFFPFPAPFPPFPVFFYSFLDCRRAKLGYYRRHYLPSFPLSSNFVQCLLSTRSFPVSFSFARSFRSFSSFPFFFLSSCFSFLRCSGRREGREYYLFGLCVFVGESTETAVFFS